MAVPNPSCPAVGATLRFLACAVGAKTTVEIGTGCGSSGIWLLRGMRPGSTLTSVDTEPEYQRVARKAFQAAGFAQNQCRLILGRALDVLPRLSDGAYDMVFCDADPRDYQDYLSAALRLLRTGGVVAFNNALLAGNSGDDEGDVSGVRPRQPDTGRRTARARAAAARRGPARRGQEKRLGSDSIRSPNHGLQGITKPGRLVGSELNN